MYDEIFNSDYTINRCIRVLCYCRRAVCLSLQQSLGPRRRTQHHTIPYPIRAHLTSPPTAAPSQSASGKRVPSGTTRWWDGPRPQTRARHTKRPDQTCPLGGTIRRSGNGSERQYSEILKAQRQIQGPFGQCEHAVRLLFCGNLTRMRPVRLRLDEAMAGETV